MNKKLSTTQIARMLGVSDQSIANWIDQGQIKAGRTPGGHRRVEADDLVVFLKHQKLRVPPELYSTAPAILVVDDEPAVAQLVAQIVQKARPEYRVLCAHDGYAAGEAVAAEHPVAVVLDLYMPGLDGFSVCQRLKANQRTADVVVIAMTAYPSSEAEQKILGAGAAVCLTKPLDIPSFCRQLDALVPAGPG
jgi:excisionase family DNA binding protein